MMLFCKEKLFADKELFMKFLKRGIAVLLCLLLCGCGAQPNVTEPSTLPQPTLSAPQKYDAAKQATLQAQNLILDYTLLRTRYVGEDTYLESVTGTASFSHLGQEDMVAVVEERLDYGSYSASYNQVYCEGIAYAELKDSVFSTQQTPQVFVQRQIPAVLISSENYGSVTEEIEADTTRIFFSQGTPLEAWLKAPEGARSGSSSGTAVLHSSGDLLQTTCLAEYTCGDVRYTCEASVRVTRPKSLDLSGKHPDHYENCQTISDLDAPKRLMQVVGDVYTAGRIHCDAVETIYSAAIPVTYTQKSNYDAAGKGEDLKVTNSYDINLSDYRGEVSTKKQVDTYEDGVFYSSVDGDHILQPNVTPQDMRQYCEDAVLSALMAPKYLSGAQRTAENGVYRLEFTGNDAFVADMMVGITQFLQVDLDGKADAVHTREAKGYLTVDMVTGLPVAMGLSLQRSHTMAEVAYDLTYQLDQTIKLS